MADTFSDQIIIQLPMGLRQDDLGIRHRLEEELEAAFTDSGIGVVDGGDIGSGTMNVFALVQSGRWDEAMAAACAVLATMRVSEVAVIARRDITDDESMPSVVWPEGLPPEFRYW
jgi:hypothetical protein